MKKIRIKLSDQYINETILEELEKIHALDARDALKEILMLYVEREIDIQLEQLETSLKKKKYWGKQ